VLDVQTLLHQATADAHGVTTLVLHAPPGTKELVLDGALRLPAGLHLVAPAGSGITIRARNDTDRSYRTQPAFIIAGTSENPIRNVTLEGIRLSGAFAYPPISIHDADHIAILNVEVVGARGGGIAVQYASQITIRGMTMRFQRLPANDPGAMSDTPREGGAGIWCYACNDTQVDHNFLDATQFWQPGPSWDSGNGAVCVQGKNRPGCTLTRFANNLARALDLVAFYGGSRNTISDNHLSHGNAAGIYLNRCSQPRGVFAEAPTDYRIFGNVVTQMREHGLDIVSANRLRIFDNRIDHVGGAGIATSRTTWVDIVGNAVANPVEADHPKATAVRTGGVILLQTTGSRLTANTIDPGAGAYAIYFKPLSEAGSQSPSDLIRANTLRSGFLGVTNLAGAE